MLWRALFCHCLGCLSGKITTHKLDREHFSNDEAVTFRQTMAPSIAEAKWGYLLVIVGLMARKTMNSIHLNQPEHQILEKLDSVIIKTPNKRFILIKNCLNFLRHRVSHTWIFHSKLRQFLAPCGGSTLQTDIAFHNQTMQPVLFELAPWCFSVTVYTYQHDTHLNCCTLTTDTKHFEGMIVLLNELVKALFHFSFYVVLSTN